MNRFAPLLSTIAIACAAPGSVEITPDAGAPAITRCDGRWPADLQLGTTGDDRLLGLALDARDDVIASGYEHGVDGVTNIEPDGDARGIVMSFAPSGELRWKSVIDTPGTDTVEDVEVDPLTGHVVFVGRTSGAFRGFANQGQFDAIVGELDGDGGGITSLAQLGDERPQHPARVSLGAAGAIGVAGWDDTYVPSNYVAADANGFAARFDRRPGAPAEAWSRYADPRRANYRTDVAVDPTSGAIYVSGIASTGPYVAKLDAGGAPVWTRSITGIPFDAANAIALAPTGELYATGGTFAQLGAASFGQEDAFVVRLDPATGATIWAAQAGGPGSDFPTAIALAPGGDVVIAGVTDGTVGGGAASAGSLDVFAMRFDATGALRGSWQRGTAGDELATSVVVDRCDDVIVGGWTSGALVDGAVSAGRNDMFLMRAAI